MRVLKVLKKTWLLVDTLLMGVIFSLVALLIFDLHASRETKRQCTSQGCSEELAAPPRPEQSRVGRGSTAVSVAPVAYERGRATQIARNMVSSEVATLPVRQTLDMRERGNKYMVSFSLPKEVGEEDVWIEVAGNILTLVIETGDKTCLQRVRIPCDFAGESSLNHYISNQLLVVEISK
ncbi:MAG: hypothetical protein PHO37_12080 [Kiritimatiellae bacterium]|nr:hypothetical protein [Kiritimatiellia bacterium]